MYTRRTISDQKKLSGFFLPAASAPASAPAAPTAAPAPARLAALDLAREDKENAGSSSAAILAQAVRV